MKHILVTGANGLLGSNIVRVLLAQNYEVTAFILPGSSKITLQGLPIQILEGNILDSANIQAAVKGKYGVIHAAALTTIWPTRAPSLRKVNVQGTANLLEACKIHKTQRLVHIGSASSFGFGTIQQPGTEQNPYPGDTYSLDYVQTKYEGQNLVLEAFAKWGCPAIIIAPTFMFGPYDATPSSGRLILAVKDGKVPAYAHGGKNYVHARDVATAAVNALKMGTLGQCYIAGHKNMHFVDVLQLIAQTVEGKAPTLRIPKWAMLAFGRFGSTWGHLSGNTPKISLPMTKIACDLQFFSPQKAVIELQMPQTPLKTAIQEAYDWFIEADYIGKY